MARYRVRGKNALMNHSWVDEQGKRHQKIFKEGDEIPGITEKLAREFRSRLEPLDDEAKAILAPAKPGGVQVPAKARAHEKVEILTNRKAELETELKQVDESLAEAEKQGAEEQRVREQKKVASQPPRETPQVAPVATEG